MPLLLEVLLVGEIPEQCSIAAFAEWLRILQRQDDLRIDQFHVVMFLLPRNLINKQLRLRNIPYVGRSVHEHINATVSTDSEVRIAHVVEAIGRGVVEEEELNLR